MPYRPPCRLSLRAFALAAFAVTAAAGAGAGVWLSRQAGDATAMALIRAVTLTGDVLALPRSP
jgi:hypothetical protein